MQNGYWCYLQDAAGVILAQDFFTNKKIALKWARGRSGVYALIIQDRYGRTVEERIFSPL